MIGVRDEYIPSTWANAEGQAPQILDRVLAPTPEGVKLADILLDLASDSDGGLVTRRLLESLTRYNLGDEIAEWLEIPRNPGMDEGLALSWPIYVQAKEAGLTVPLSGELYWGIDEILRQGVLYFLSDGEPLYIEIPETNNPNHEDGSNGGKGGGKPQGRLKSARFREESNGDRLLEVELHLKERLRVEADLVRNGDTLALVRRSALEAGSRTVRMRLPDDVDKGPARLLVAFTERSGTTRRASRELSVPARG
jgi:hypothetical protein